ncbi:pyridine nucleotide-disulfide oxidoreductase-domain-containing protein [Lipomyces oligophaga]|uniref:pyridine nucleotide-disulfide oxidoreductase-domain-containing protein n=1 Tax=Lipomyces oligophaga TaxID=45792 RepID=UPI0034CDF387
MAAVLRSGRSFGSLQNFFSRTAAAFGPRSSLLKASPAYSALSGVGSSLQRRGYQSHFSREVLDSYNLHVYARARPCGLSGFHGRYGYPMLTSSYRQFSTTKQLQTEAEPVSSTAPEPTPSLAYRVLRLVKLTIYSLGAIGATVLILVAGFFVYDSSTYKDLDDSEDVEISELALNPRIGGPKNLPILERYLDDEDCDVHKLSMSKPRLVILGSGWGAVALLKNIYPTDYHITVISPRNHFLFTPMLPSATVGTLEYRSLVEPIRRICRRVRAHYLEASAEKIEFDEHLIEVSQKCPDGSERRFYVPYDKVVVAVGSQSNTHGVPGMEYCNFLKTIDDARDIRRKVLQNFELACLPGATEEERKRLLSFVVCGGGPTGVEFAAELYDLLNEDLTNTFPRVLRNLVSVHVVQSQGHILNTYDEKISEYAQERFLKDSIDVLTNARVQRVENDRVIFTQKDAQGNPETKELPCGLCLWSTGVALCDITKEIATTVKGQSNRRAIETDSHLRVLGTPMGEVYAIGDCSTIRTNITEHMVEFVKLYAVKNNISVENCEITFQQWRDIAYNIKRRFPQAAENLRRVDQLFTEYDKDNSGTLGFHELSNLLRDIDSKMTSLPATAQRANQQGEYLGRKLTRLARARESLAMQAYVDNDLDDLVYKPFGYHHLGSLAYIGNAAVFDLNGYSFVGGLVAMYLWRSVYFAQSVSFRTRALLFMDWLKRGIFGRDMTDV